MLISLKVHHLAVVEDIELHFLPGMTSLTGETGAGKSILVDALGLALGDRADSNMIRYGHDRADIYAELDISTNPALQHWLCEQELDDAICLLRRTISKDGRSRAYINGKPVPVSHLKEVGKRAIDIQGQHAHQSLLRTEVQRQILDAAAQNQSLLEQLATAYQEWRTLQDKLEHIRQQAKDNADRRELLRYQVQELEALTLTPEAIQDLLQEQQELAHAAQLIQSVESSLQQLYDQEYGAAYTTITAVLSSLEKLQDIAPRLQNPIELLHAVVIQLDECDHELRHYLDSIELDPARLAQIEQQLGQMHALARKHQIEIEDLPAYYDKLKAELVTLAHIEHDSDALAQACQDKEAQCRKLCAQIRTRRQKAAPKLAQRISQAIQQLAIPHGKIDFILSPMEDDRFNETGADRIHIQVSTNPGQPAGELAKIASGGELARISLAIQVVTADTKSVPTLVFDEVDVGIGGGIAEIVGQHLRKLAHSRQVICITHLPQVAVQAQQQLQVRKQESNANTAIEVRQLNARERVEEIARMLGGVTLTEKTRQHAQEMLEQAKITD